MGKHNFYEALWNIKHIRDGKVIWEIKDKKNILCDEGEKAIVDTFFRGNAATYFGVTDFYIGLYNGTISEATKLTNIPSEPSGITGMGYSRQKCERSSIGFPTLEQDDGNWRVVSKEIELIATGGDIGPVNGAFLGTSLNNTGSLIGAIAMGVERTVVAGDKIIFQMRIKLK